MDLKTKEKPAKMDFNEKYRNSKAAINHLNRNCQRYIKEIEEITGKEKQRRRITVDCLRIDLL